MPSNATNRTVTGLTNGQEYLFRVAAVNSAGTGPFSSTTTVTPNFVPDTVIVAGYTNPTYALYDATITLALSGTTNGRPSYTSGVWALAWTGSDWRLTYYGDWMAASSSNTPFPPSSGWSQQTITVWISTAGEPSYPTSLSAATGDNKLTLTWTAPGSNGSGAITGYTVEYTPAGGSPQTVSTGSTSTTYELTGLTNDTSYSVRVAAVNAYGTGPWSAAASGTPAYVPAAVIVSGYVNPTYGRTGSDTTLTLAGTSNGRPYYTAGYDAVAWTGSVWRYSYYGDTFATNSSNTTLPPTTGWSHQGMTLWISAAGEPSYPTSVLASTGNNKLTLTWTAPAVNGSGSITGYTVEYTPAGGSAQTVNTGSNATTYELTGLTNDTSYSVRVAAVNAYGTGPWSAAATGTPAYIPESIVLSGYVNPVYGRNGDPVTLTFAGTSNGRPYYTAGNDAVSWTGSVWRYSYYGDTFATNSNNTTLPPDTGWSDPNIVVTGGSTVPPPPPVITITSQPSNQTASNGSATFSVTATATQSATLSYQWQKQEGGSGSFTNVSGATSSSLVLSGLTNADDNGDVYRCVVSATGGAESVTSSSATLTVAADSGPPFVDPTSITGLQLWLDASSADTLYDATSAGSLVTADGAVARWEDKSGNSRHATQSTSNRRPLRKTSVQGGKDVLRFDGNHFLSLPSSTETFKFLHSSDHTIFVVFENTNDSYAPLVSTSNGNSLSTGALLYAASNTVVNQVYRNVSESFVIRNTSDQNFLPLGFTVLSLVAKPTDGTAANRSAIRKNGGSPVANNSDTAAVNTGNATSDLRIGAAGRINIMIEASGFISGDIAEVIIYTSALSDTDRAAVETYLMQKWAIA